MVTPVIRPATEADREALVWLEGAARSALTAQRGGDLWLERHPAQSPAWEAIADGGVIVSAIDDVPVGYLRLRVETDVLYVEDVYVHPDAREIGCGDALLAAGIDVGVDRGATRVEAEALPGDRDTKNLYERAAITAKRITVSAPIGPATGPIEG
jgi:GNAT superfamily N-acetyltransferase